VYCWTAWNLRDDHRKCLEMEFRTYLSSDLFCWCTVEPGQSSISFTSVLLNWLQKKKIYSLYLRENAVLIRYATVAFCIFGRGPHWWSVTFIWWRCHTHLMKTPPLLIVAFEMQRSVGWFWMQMSYETRASLSDVCSAHIELEICAAYHGHWTTYKKTKGLWKVNSFLTVFKLLASRLRSKSFQTF